ncbi:peptidyl-prolyl cis-trans isomerase 10 [Planoprotostelium fungivorum]|uniref:Peptidyl-prolyl cis-trans isomerase n=1 Tax=Planoprotostelium fungivorum TaxID=1890364 RepID=A0A2P6N8I4_9EUKA|nr:peptidyl-prolyl cis-trans isomerase 10 [Planoprotostelium fungivorum]
MSVTLQTNLGDIKIEVACDLVPLAAENFLALCASGYYDDTIFHRNIKGFMIQGGDPTGTGKGGQSAFKTKLQDEFHPNLQHNARGIVSFANNGPDSNGSQFFITYGKQLHLNNVYTIFGKVIYGLDTLDKMERVPVDGKDFPLKEIKINKNCCSSENRPKRSAKRASLDSVSTQHTLSQALPPPHSKEGDRDFCEKRDTFRGEVDPSTMKGGNLLRVEMSQRFGGKLVTDVHLRDGSAGSATEFGIVVDHCSRRPPYMKTSSSVIAKEEVRIHHPHRIIPSNFRLTSR